MNNTIEIDRQKIEENIKKWEEMSHNVYSVDKEDTLTKRANYLIYNGNLIFAASCITEAIEICKTENKICSIFERAGKSNGKFWQHLIDCSKGVL